jgi:hypothetical protein
VEDLGARGNSIELILSIEGNSVVLLFIQEITIASEGYSFEASIISKGNYLMAQQMYLVLSLLLYKKKHGDDWIDPSVSESDMATSLIGWYK